MLLLVWVVRQYLVKTLLSRQKEVDVDNELSALNTIFTEFYYWVTVVLMFLIHVGFCMYEVGASRYKNHLHTLMKNTILIPLVLSLIHI